MSRTMAQIAQEMKEYVNSKGYEIEDILKNPVIFTLLESTAHQIELTESMIEDVVKHYFVSDDEGDGLDKRLSERGLTARFSGSKAVGNILLGKNSEFVIGVVVPKDTVFKTMDGKVEVVVTENTNIVAGTTSCLVPVQSKTIGTSGNLAANTELTYSGVSINEVETIRVDTVGLSGGLGAESDVSVKIRLLDDMKNQVASNNKNHFVKWAKEVVGVGGAICIPLWDGPNTVKVAIVNESKMPASPELVAQVQNYIDPAPSGTGEGQAQFGSFVTVVAATAVNINITATLNLAVGYELADIQSEFVIVLGQYLSSIALQSDNNVRYTKIGTLLLDIEGVIDYSDLLVNGATSNVDIDSLSVAVVGVVSLDE